MYILTLTNKQTNEVHTYDNVIDINAGEKLYYRFQINTLGLVDGEYDLELTKDGILVGVNTLYVGDYETYSLQYKRGDNTFIDITLNAKLEDATAEINVEKFTLLPSEGYDGFSKVEIDATPLYDVAFGDGYASGSTDGVSRGIEIQKELLESIVINENGTYTREDGYNSVVVNVPDLNGDYQTGYNEGYADGEAAGVENAGEILAANAIVLDATENKTYYTKYSDNIQYPEEVTGIYPDSEKFYDYISLKNTKTNFSGEYQITPSSKIEIWWNNQNENGDLNGDNFIFGFKLFLSIFRPLYNTNYTARFFSTNGISFAFEYVGWHHIVLSANGLFINDKKIGDFNININQGASDIGNIFYINNYVDLGNSADGSYGMIKLDDTIIIPTADGFLNTNTNELLNKSSNSYYFSNNDPIILDNLIKQVNVNVKINVAENGIKFAYSTFTEVPEIFDFSNVTDMNSMFANCGNLITIAEIDTSNVTNMAGCFQNCGNLITIAEIDTSNVTNLSFCFQNCGNLITIAEIDTSNVTNLAGCFQNCSNLQTLPELNTAKVDNIGYYFRGAGNNLTDVGGWVGLKINWDDNYGLVRCPNLTYQSCINILNGLADVTELGGRTLKVHQNFIDSVGDEISIGTNKNWTITA